MQKKLVQKSDVVFTAVIVAVILLIWFFMLPSGKGRDVEIRQNGEVIATLPLSENTTYQVTENYTNIFEIKNGEVRIVETDCPNHQCEKSGSISHTGQSIVCAPNGVSATIAGGEADIDAVTG